MDTDASCMRFDNQTVLITGASRGIGREAARLFADAGARVAVHYRVRADAAEETLASLEGKGHAIFAADLADESAVRRLMDDVIESMGGVDVLVNNAGIFEYHDIADIDCDGWLDAWRRTLATNLMGPALLSFLAAKHMMTKGGGRIVNVSSRGAFRGEPRAPAYGASKAGLNAMGQSLAQALAPHGVYVFNVAPGFVETDMAKSSLSGPGGDAIRGQSPLGRVARPEEVARTVMFLASKGSEFLTGGIVDVNGASYLRS